MGSEMNTVFSREEEGSFCYKINSVSFTEIGSSYIDDTKKYHFI